MMDLGGDSLPWSVNRSSGLDHVNRSTPCHRVESSANVFFMLVYSLVFVVGLLLNGFTLKVYFCRAQQPASSSSVTIYLKNLVLADFLFCLGLPLRIAKFDGGSPQVHHVYCKFGSAAFYLNMYASILFMGYIAANRYLKIVSPLGTQMQTVRVARIVSTVTWAFLLAMTTTYIVLSLVTQHPVESAAYSVSCDALHSQQVSVYYKIIHSCCAAIFLLVLVSLLFFYYSTSRRLAVAQQRQPASSGSKKLAKSRRNMLVLVSVFCVCFVPYHLARLPYAFLSRHCSLAPVFFYVKELTTMLSVLNVCLDPLIYFIFCKAFRAQLSFRRRFSTSRVGTLGPEGDRRSSEERTSNGRVNRRISLTSTTTRQINAV